MKKAFYIVLLSLAGAAYSQNLPVNLEQAVKESRVMEQDSVFRVQPDFNYISKNYDKIFRYDQYTFDALEYSQRIYIGNINNWNNDNNTPHIFRVMPLAGVNVDACLAQPSNAGYIQE